MPRFENMFGPFELDLPQIRPLPMRQQVAPSTVMQPVMPQAQSLPTDNSPSEWEQMISGVTGLMKQDREQKEKAKEKDWLKEIEALKANRTKLEADIAAIRAEKQSGTSGATASGALGPDGLPVYTGDYESRVGQFESNENLDATNPGSNATGLYQFLPSTWAGIMREAPELGLTMEGIKTREQQNKAMKFYTDRSRGILRNTLGRDPSGGELYLLHLLGHGGGPRVLADLDAPITSTIDPRAYAGNPFLKQYKTGHDLIAGLNKRFGA